VPYWNPATGEAVAPSEPNATKFEMFVFDALGFVEKGLVYETDRIEEFAPIKNADGSDSPATSGALQTERAARWMESAGAVIPRRPDGSVNGRIEINPGTALDAHGLSGRTLPTMTPGDDLVF
jgi:UDP-N-acetylglucosamine/UDP-N-acetylgalactosamine diphosphorylase